MVYVTDVSLVDKHIMVFTIRRKLAALPSHIAYDSGSAMTRTSHALFPGVVIGLVARQATWHPKGKKLSTGVRR